LSSQNVEVKNIHPGGFWEFRAFSGIEPEIPVNLNIMQANKGMLST